MDHVDKSMFDDVSDQDRARLQTVWNKKHYAASDYCKARDGDHIITPFECDLCVFRKLRGVDPSLDSHSDCLLLGCIRRANLDAFWSRSTLTVNRNKGLVEQQLKLSRMLGLNGPFIHEGPMPYFDHCGFEIAVSILLKSRDTTGRHSSKHVQFDTIRKLRSCYGNQVRAAPSKQLEEIQFSG